MEEVKGQVNTNQRTRWEMRCKRVTPGYHTRYAHQHATWQLLPCLICVYTSTRATARHLRSCTPSHSRWRPWLPCVAAGDGRWCGRLPVLPVVQAQELGQQ